MDPLRQLYDGFVQRNMYSKSFEEFQSQFATAGAQESLYNGLVERNMYTKSLEDFQNQFFAPKQVQVDPTKEAFMNDALQTMTQQQADKAWGMTQSKPKEQQFIQGDLGNTINSLGWFGDFIDDMYGYISAGQKIGASQDEVLEAAFAAPEELTDEMISEFYQTTYDQSVKTEEMQAFEKQIQEGGDTWGNTLYAYFQNPSVIVGQALQSMAMLANEESIRTITQSTAVGAGAGAVAGGTAGSFTVPLVGTAVGAGGGATLGAATGLRAGIGLASGSVEASAIVVDAFRERAQREGREYNEDTLADYLTDAEFMKKVRRDAMAGGATVAVIDAVTGGLGTAVAKKQIAKGASKTAVAVTGALIEGTGGGIGEATKQKVIGKDLSPSEIVGEALGGGPGSVINVLTAAVLPGKYSITTEDGKVVNHSRKDMAEFIENSTPEELKDASITIEKDKDLKALLDKKLGLSDTQASGDGADEVPTDPFVAEEMSQKKKILEQHRNGQISDQERDDLLKSVTDAFSEKQDEELRKPPRGRRLFGTPAKPAVNAARKFREVAPDAPEEGAPIRKIDKKKAMSIADAYEAMQHDPENPEVREAYEAMATETEAQYELLKQEGVEVEIFEGEGEPYANSQEMLDDLNNNNHLFILSTEKDFGQTGITESQRAENPLLNESKFTDKNGKPMLVNDVFRAVHDFFGHGERGNSFGAIGEENAWDVHARMYSPKARRAMTTETRGQNSWVNFGPQMRDSEGGLLHPKDVRYLQAKDRAFAEQKMGLLPEEFSELPSRPEVKTPVSQVADQVGVSPRNLRDLVKTYRTVFGLDLNEALSAAVVSDRMVQTMAERNGVSKEEQYDKFEFVQSPDGLPKEVNESSVLFQGDFSEPRSRVTFAYDKNGDLFARLEREGKITRDMSLSDFPEGAEFVLHSPDDAFSGEIYKDGELLVEGQGGMYYPVKYNDKGFVWAGTGKGTAAKLAELLNQSAARSEDGKARLALATGAPTKNLSTLKSANAVIETLFGFSRDPKFGVTQGQVTRAIKRAAKNVKNKKGTKALPFDIPAMLTEKELISFLRDALRPPLSFDDRRAFVIQVLTEFTSEIKSQKTRDELISFFGEGIQNKSPLYKAKPGKKLSATALTEGFAYMLGEPMLRDVTRDGKSGRVYAVIEVSRPEGMSKNQDVVTVQEDSTHESYPFAIKAADGAEIKLHVLDEVSMWDESFQDPTTGGPISQENKLKLFPSSGLAFNTLRLKDKTLFQSAREKGTESTSESVVYRAGNLTDKAEPAAKMRTRRSTGHFGTGFYFFSDEKRAVEYAESDNREISQLNIADYNLARATKELHEVLKDINNSSEASDAMWSGGDYEFSTYTFIRVGEVTGDFVTKEQAREMRDRAQEIFNKQKDIPPARYRERDSISTIVMKAMGYEGVNAVGTDLDNSTYGTVIYDIKPTQERSERLEGAPVRWEETPIRNMRDSEISVRKDVISEAAADLKNGKITTEEYIAKVREFDKTGPIGQFFAAVSEDHMKEGLNAKQQEKIMAPLESKDGAPIERVGLRLDIPAYLNSNAWIVSIHDGPDGAPVSYRPAARIRNVEFSTDPRLALQVASNAMNKATFARMVGENVEIEGSTVEEVGRNGEKLIEAVKDDPSWVQVGMNPFRHSYFYDRATMQPVVAAEEVIQVGGLVYAKNVEYASPTDPRFMVMAEPSGKTLKGKTEESLKASDQPLLDKNGDPVYFQDKKAAIVMQNGKFIIHAMTSPDVSSPVHEMAHAYETVLTEQERKDVLDWAGSEKWDRSVSEKFARGFENYLATEEAPTPALKVAFDQFKKFMIEIYNGITGSEIDLELNDPMKRIFEDMLGAEAVVDTSTERTRRPNRSADGGNKGGKLRKFAKRVAADMPSVRKDIMENPENYFEPQVLANIKQDLEGMDVDELFGLVRETSLVNLSKAQNEVGVLAGIELINRAAAKGDMAMVSQITEDLAKIGTSAGRILRHFAELKSSTPVAMFEVIRDAAEKNGRNLTEAESAEVMKRVSVVLEDGREIKAITKELVNGTNLSEADYAKLEVALEAAQNKITESDRNLIRLTNALIEDEWGSLFGQLMQGNLLTPMSQATNVFANLYNLGLVLPVNFVAGLTMPAVKALGQVLGASVQNSKPFSLGAFYHGVKGFGKGVKEAVFEVKTGQSKGDVEWRIQRGFFPLMSLAAAMNKNGALTKMGLESPLSSSQKAKLFVKGTIGIPAEVMFRLLSLGDAPFRKFAEGYSVYAEAKARGLQGQEFERFVKHPPFDVMEQAAKEGRELTFQEQTRPAKFVENVIGNLRRGLEETLGPKVGGLLNYALIKTQFPFVRTPVNILVESVKYTVPAVAVVDGVLKSSRGETREAAQSFAKAIIGTAIAKLAEEMMKEGLMSSEIEWEPKESKKNIAYDQFPPNSINISGLRRKLDGGDPSVQPGDRFWSYQKLGLIGTIFGATSSSYDGENLVSEQTESLLGNVVGIKGATTVNYVLNQGFLTGANNLAKILGETDEARLEKALENWMNGMFNAITATGLPNTTSALHRANRTYMPDYRVTKDMSFGERIVQRLRYTILDRTYGMAGGDLESVPVRVNWKGQPIRQTPEGADPVAYNLFDVNKARNAESDPVSNEIYRLYVETDILSNVVSTPYYARNRKVSVPKQFSRKDYVFMRRSGRDYTFINDPSFAGKQIYLSTELISELMKVSGQQRYNDVKNFIESPEYQRLTDEQRLARLDEISNEYNGVLEYTRGGLKDHSLLLLDAMQMMYEQGR